MFRFLYRVLCGFFLGISVVAPGFSGSIVAITMGIYQDLLRIVSNPFKNFKQNFFFCLPLGVGAAVSAVLFVLTFRFLFEAHTKATYLLFIGLIAGNFPVIFREIKKCGFKMIYLLGGGGAFIAALVFGLLAVRLGTASEAVAEPVSIFLWALGGFAGGITALVPGMSVTIVLIIAGVYSQLIVAAESMLRFDFTHLFPFAVFCVCAIAGLVIASRGIKYIFSKHPGFSNSTVFGFMSGALIGILIDSLRMDDANFTWLSGCIMLAAGLGISMMFLLLGKPANKA